MSSNPKISWVPNNISLDILYLAKVIDLSRLGWAVKIEKKKNINVQILAYCFTSYELSEKNRLALLNLMIALHLDSIVGVVE